MSDYRKLSLWFDQLLEGGESLTPRPALNSHLSVDVAIVGGGYTGLWTAYYLAKEQPDLTIAIFEAEIAGFGASGRNGGWCSALFPRSAASLAAKHGTAKAMAMRKAMIDTVDEVGRVVAEENIDCDFIKGGTLEFARSQVQWQKAKDAYDEARSFGVDRPILFDGVENARFGVSNLVGTYYEPDCARLQPAKLARSLATVVENLGVRIYEKSPVDSWQAHTLTVGAHTVTADNIVLAVEGYRAQIDSIYRGDERPKQFPSRSTLPLYSLMIATEPLSDATWERIGIAQGETFSDFRNLLIYGQRTADNRFAFGGRGARYHWGSAIKAEFDRSPKIFKHLHRTLKEMFPQLGDAAITHTWGGPLGVARDWHASVGLDSETRVGWAGGYVGDGVSTTNLAGRTLADLITQQSSSLTALPWVQHDIKPWEPEPLRFVGTNLGLSAMSVADAEEKATGKPSFVAKVMGPLIGG